MPDMAVTAAPKIEPTSATNTINIGDTSFILIMSTVILQQRPSTRHYYGLL